MARSRSHIDQLETETESEFFTNWAQKSQLSEIVDDFDKKIDKLFEEIQSLKDFRLHKGV